MRDFDLCEAMGCGCQQSQGCFATSLQDTNPLGHIPKIESIGVPALVVLTDLVDLHHAAQLGKVPRDEVQEGELVIVLGLLVAVLHHLQHHLINTPPCTHSSL